MRQNRSPALLCVLCLFRSLGRTTHEGERLTTARGRQSVGQCDYVYAVQNVNTGRTAGKREGGLSLPLRLSSSGDRNSLSVEMRRERRAGGVCLRGKCTPPGAQKGGAGGYREPTGRKVYHPSGVLLLFQFCTMAFTKLFVFLITFQSTRKSQYRKPILDH